ncbi:MAG: hypothetical protein HY064_15630 [Bacteroidetes bacterium]|nr:hypothetical protein [Bacteroidota bacterium]
MKSPKPSSLLLFLAAITLLTRLPFLFDGFGAEEDSWGLVVNAFQMKQCGHYMASRFPGHPLQEYAYVLAYHAPAWLYNSMSALMSVAAVLFFYKAARKMQLPYSFAASLAFSFAPCFFIAGTYTIDFAWSLAFVMASFYFLLSGKNILCGIMIGLAIGCRITSGIFIVPWAILLFSKLDLKFWMKNILLVTIPAIITGILFYIPAYRIYGFSFFNYSDQFPYPGMAKVFFKMSFGVFGSLGIISILIFLFPAMKNLRKRNIHGVTLFSSERLLFASVTIIVLLIISYLRLPQKSGYLLPVIPFLIIIFALLLNKKQFRIFTFLFILSPFLFGINLTDSIRGANYSSLAFKLKISGQELFFDPLNGPALAERSKRINKMKFCDEVISAMKSGNEKSFIIAGWWYNEIQTHYYEMAGTGDKHFLFYKNCNGLDSIKNSGGNIFYLPEQNLNNDEMYGQNCTDSLAKQFPKK